MKNRLVLIVVVVLFIAVVPAFGEITGNDVLNSCQTAVRFVDNDGGPTGEQFDSGWCVGWVNAALELTKLHNEWATLIQEKPALLQFCVGVPGIPVIQAVRVVVKYLKETPNNFTKMGWV